MPGESQRTPGRKVVPGVNDLATRCPEAARLWDGERNGAEASQVAYGSKKKYWWRCDRGHRWQAAVYSLTLCASRCPVCAGRRADPGATDLAAQRPEVLALWDREKNTVEPTQVTPGSHRRVWWRCEQGHSWQAMVFSVATGGRRCPICAKPGPKPRTFSADNTEKRMGKSNENGMEQGLRA